MNGPHKKGVEGYDSYETPLTRITDIAVVAVTEKHAEEWVQS